MKKNNVMRIASALLVAVLLTTCAISGTFAKYTTTAYGNSAARVAKWGFGTTEIEFDLFEDTYENVETDVDPDVNVIAPGTTKTTTISLVPANEATATEVAYTFDVEISIDGDDTLLSKLQWKLNDGQFGTFDQLKADLNTLLDGDHEAGEALATEFTITWEWPFYVNNEADTSDTELGAADLAEVEVTISFTATQKGATVTTTEAAGE